MQDTLSIFFVLVDIGRKIRVRLRAGIAIDSEGRQSVYQGSRVCVDK